MLMEASRGGHTKVVQLLIDFPNSISHLLPVVAQPHPSVAGGTAGGAGEVTTGAPFLEGDPHPLSMGLTVVPSSDPLVLNANQALFNDMGKLMLNGFCLAVKLGLQILVIKVLQMKYLSIFTGVSLFICKKHYKYVKFNAGYWWDTKLF